MKKFVSLIFMVVLPFGLVVGGGLFAFRKYKKMKAVKEKQAEITKSKGWKYFTLSELDKRKNKEVDIDEATLKNLDTLVTKVLDPLREKYGHPINVTSGLRDYVPSGGSTTSDHLKGCAVDIEGFDYSNAENKKLAELFLDMNLPYSQLINEFGWSWFHVAYNPKDSRKRLTLSTNRANPQYTQVKDNKVKFLG